MKEYQSVIKQATLSSQILIECHLGQFEIPDVSQRDNDVMIMTSDFPWVCPLESLIQGFDLQGEVGNFHDYQVITVYFQPRLNQLNSE